MSGSLAALSPGQQIEAVYIAYFNRAADGGGYLYWSNDFAAAQHAGTPADAALTGIAQSFSVQPEATALYAFLASPPPIPAANPSSPNPIAAAEIDVFLIAVYGNLFNRTVDSGGEVYWSNAILSGAVSVGSAIYAIANGATGNDLTVLDNKIAAASYFTAHSAAAGLGLVAPLGQPFLTAAQNAVVGVTDAASVSRSEAATDAWTTPPGAVALPAAPGALVADSPTVTDAATIAAAAGNLATAATFVSAQNAVDVSVSAFGFLLSNLDQSGSAGFDPVTVAAATAGTANVTPAIFTAPLAPGANVTYAAGTEHANVLLLGSPFANAGAVAQSLGSAGSVTSALTFVHGLTLDDLGAGQPGGLEYAGHVLLAYANAAGNVVIADLDIAATARTIFSTEAGTFTDASGGQTFTETIAVSDLVTLTGVSLASLQTQNIHFVA